MPTRRTAATGRQQRHTRVDEFDTARIDKKTIRQNLAPDSAHRPFPQQTNRA